MDTSINKYKDLRIYNTCGNKKSSSMSSAELLRKLRRNQISSYGKSSFYNKIICNVKSLFDSEPTEWLEVKG